MIDINLQFHLAMFGSYEDIAPKPDTLKYFIDEFADKELVPTSVQGLGLAFQEQSLVPINRLSLKSADEVWSIDFRGNRIDIRKTNKNVGVVDMGDFKQFLEEAKHIAKIIEHKFPKTHNRFGAVSKYLMGQMTKEEISNVFHKGVKTIGIFEQNEPMEWSSRVVTKVKQQISVTEETFNVMAELNRTKGNLKINSKNEIIDRVELLFDINTYEGVTDYRFGIEDLVSFTDKANEIENLLKSDYIKLLS